MRILAILILMLAMSTFADSGVELPKNAPIPIVVEQLDEEANALGLTEDLVELSREAAG